MINLMPQDLKENIKFAKLNVKLLNFSVLVIMISVLLATIMFVGVNLVKSEEDNLKVTIDEKTLQIAKLGNVDKQSKELAADVKTISNLFNKSVDFSQLLKDIGSVIPPGVRLTDLALTGDDKSPLQITAIADTQTGGAVLRKNIEESTLFKGADILSISSTTINNQQKYSAVLVVQFASDKERAAAEAES